MHTASTMTGNYWDKILPDILAIILYTFCLEPMIAWQFNNPALSCTLLMFFNIVAVSFGCLRFFSLYADTKQLIAYKNQLPKWESAVLGLSIFISVVGFLWWLVPFAVVKKMGVTDTGFFIGLGVYFISFMAIVANSVNEVKTITLSNTTPVRLGAVISTTVFFFFSYSFLLMTMRQTPDLTDEGLIINLLCLCVFFLPLRFFLLFQPPRKSVEYISFLLSFGFMLFTLFNKK
jgi:hypothetical protein